MTIRRYVASKDTTITDAYKANAITRGEDSNMGASDILEIFSIYGQVTTSSYEKSRVLVQFPVADIISDRTNKLISQSGSCQFILKLSNAPHGDSTPENISVSVSPLSRSWNEGNGLDMEGYTDVGVANWLSASSTETWTTAGGDIVSPSFNQVIENSYDDLELDITSLVEEWISGVKQNNGLLIQLSSSLENDTESYYTKKFFARRSEFFFKKPWIEVRCDSSIKDNRNNFYASSNLLDASENKNTLFIYNTVKGQLKNIPSVGTGTLLVSLYSGTVTSGPLGVPVALENGSVVAVTGGYYATGIYTASVGYSGTLEYLYDVWSTLSGTQLVTGSVIEVLQHKVSEDSDSPEYILAMQQLKQKYNYKENVRFRVTVKNRDWDANLYHVASKEPDTTVIESLYYNIERIADGYKVFDYGTGSFNHTLCSYDQAGNYFDLDMKLLEPGYAYKLKFGHMYNGEFYELEDTFKFKVEK